MTTRDVVLTETQSVTLTPGILLGQEESLCAHADWSCGGGEGYCAACAGSCPDCPARLNQPRTVEGWQVRDLVQRLGGQLRFTSGAMIGWDKGAALALGQALGMNPMIAAELLSEIEAMMLRKLNRALRSGSLQGHDP